MWLVELLDETLKPMLEFLVENDYGTHYQENRVRKLWRDGLGKNETTVQLRLDWEIVKDSVDKSTQEQLNNLMLEQIKLDLEDLIENGDVNETSDALYKAMNGSKVRGQKPVEIGIIGAQLHREYKEKQYDWKTNTFKDELLPRYEYTLYVRPYIRWE